MIRLLKFDKGQFCSAPGDGLTIAESRWAEMANYLSNVPIEMLESNIGLFKVREGDYLQEIEYYKNHRLDLLQNAPWWHKLEERTETVYVVEPWYQREVK